MSGDNAPNAAVFAAIDAVKCFDVEITLVGKEAWIVSALKEIGETDPPAGMEIVNSGSGVSKADSLVDVLLRQREGSLLTGLRMLSEGRGDAFISAVSLDALLTGMPLEQELKELLKQAAVESLVTLDRNVLIKSPEDTAGFIGRGLKRTIRKNGVRALWGRIDFADMVKLRSCREYSRMIRVGKPVMLIPEASDRQMIRESISEILQTLPPKAVANPQFP